MTPDEKGLLSGIVYRRLDASAELSQARALLEVGRPAYRSPRLTGDEAWSGLWDLTVANGSALAAGAATRTMSARVLEVRALVVRDGGHWPAMWARLAREMADGCRAHGAEWMVAGTARGDAAALALLRRTAFDPCTDLRLPAVASLVWLAREV